MKMQGLRILITGGAGFIGSFLAQKTLEMGNQVVIYDNFDDFYFGKNRNIEGILGNRNFKLVKGDILDLETLSLVMRNVDVVFHMAAQAGVRYCIRNPEKAHTVNVTGTFNVLMAAKKAKVKKIIHASSSSVYGKPRYLPMDEDHPTNPNSPYAASKLAAEKYCLAFDEVYGLNVVALRFFSVYGPRQRPDQVVRKFVTEVIAGKPPIIYGDGTQTRDFTYISDVINGTISAAECDDANGMVFNIGRGSQTTINDLAEMIIELLGMEGKIEPVYQEAYPGDFPHTYADIGKARKILGYDPQISLREGVQKFIEWYKSL